ncbi:sensor histidine kinase [Nocardioides pantholopis]|uniref:sensor histidine kinase n=1 Tax=Nocardioides pantholopis TaxID=2483798 RepID=UPI000F086D37|nr:histidine kinase [Nocardioides pantholopis]
MATRWARFVASSRILDVGVVLLTLAIALNAIDGSGPFEPTALNLGIVALSCITIGWRQRYPELVLATALLAVLVTAQPAPIVLAAGSLAAKFGSGPRTWIPIALASVPMLLGLGIDDYGPVGLTLIWGCLIALPTTVGLYLNSRQLAIDAANARAEELAAAQQTLAEAARLDERTRIAREMHDIVAHQVSLIALHAGALELATEGTPAEASARMIRETARQALEELRTVVGVLRTDPNAADAERAPQASIDSLGDLVTEWRDAGADVTLLDRTPAGFLADVPPQVGRAAHRVVQEALTNVSKHAPGSRSEIVLADRDGCLSVTVHNTAGTRVSSRAATGSGTGLYGLRERVELLGGSFEAGPDGEGGYRVSALLPGRGAAP